jgi:hypothetical protein
LLSLLDNKQVTQNNSQGMLDLSINDCLYNISLCDAGVTLIFNVTLVFTNDDRTVLFSTGGDSTYSPGGFYLHQVNTRGDKYLEFGYALQDGLTTVKVCARLFVCVFLF